jgi:septal ring factor EnvC (AmiA/AmiB activator)
MKIHYEDEYGTKLYWGSEEAFPPMPGDMVVISGEEWIVKHRSFIPEEQTIIVLVTENIARVRHSENSETGRLREVQNAIVAVNKRQDASDKKSRSLNEQIGSIRKNINQRTQRENKERKDI